jgi:hypothetical protein
MDVALGARETMRRKLDVDDFMQKSVAKMLGWNLE